MGRGRRLRAQDRTCLMEHGARATTSRGKKGGLTRSVQVAAKSADCIGRLGIVLPESFFSFMELGNICLTGKLSCFSMFLFLWHPLAVSLREHESLEGQHGVWVGGCKVLG